MEKEILQIIPSTEINGLHFLHKDYSLAEDSLKEPLNRGFDLKVDDKESFVALVQEYKQDNSKIFYNFKKIDAYLDFHTKESQCFNKRVIELGLEKHPFYQAFLDNLNQPLSQRGFVAFLKSFYVFLDPSNTMSGLDLIDLSTHLNAVKNIDSIQKHTSASFCLSTTIKSGAKEEVEIPSKLTFAFQMLKASDKKVTLEIELFITLKENSFEIRLVSYDIQIKEESVLKEFINELKSEIALPCFKVKG
ncbi:MAG: DUF2303 family protein [Helicobacter sp.]|nr:DUF2303 family protein [Helicobacter sp.]